MTIFADLPPDSTALPSHDDPSLSAPWMPLDELASRRAAFGAAAQSAEALQATSAAFAAVAAEREALHSLQDRSALSASSVMQALEAPLLFLRQHALITTLTHAAACWFEAACAAYLSLADLLPASRRRLLV